MKTTSSFSKSVTRLDTQDRTVEGLRIPANLNATHAVNFVLTQEPGKLKPKDLKIAIEKNRAERDKRAEEQRKLREQGGGAGVLDIRGILAEERLNYEAGDPFRRQLRELSFLADVEEVDKQEAEKEFRVSEDYFGSNLLSSSDIEIIKQQRVLARQQALKSQWRQSLGRQEIKSYLPHMGIKAGTLQSTAQTLVSSLHPTFDPNRNDIFAKRLNTLRKFIYLVSKWIIRRRISRRMQKIMDAFHKHNAYTREEVRAYIEQENIEYKLSNQATSNISAIVAKPKQELSSTEMEKDKRQMSLPDLIFSEENIALTRRAHQQEVTANIQYAIKHGEAEFTIGMAQRSLIPSFERDLLKDYKHGGSALSAGKGVVHELLMNKMVFDDRTFIHCKVKPHYIIRQYGAMPMPKLPIYYPVGRDKDIRLEAPEEQFHRPAADSYVSSKLILPFYNATNEPEDLQILRVESAEHVQMLTNATLFPLLDEQNNINHQATQDRQRKSTDEDSLMSSLLTSQSSAPSWLTQTDLAYSQLDLNMHIPNPTYRAYKPLLPTAELDAFFHVRPHEDRMVDYIPDTSLRTQVTLRQAGFVACNTYLFGGLESDVKLINPHQTNPNLPTPPPPPGKVNYAAIPEIGPVFSDYYTADTDRHVSGLNCFAKDTDRTLLQWDLDIAPLQAQQAKEDVLTDSDSDNDEAYASEKPSMALAKRLLTAPVVRQEEPKDPKKKLDKKDDKKDAKSATSAPVAPASPGFDEDVLLNESDRRAEQVELLRDRKLLDFASTIQKQRKKQLEAVYQTYSTVASKSIPIYALPVTVPFHMYEEEVYQLMSKYVPQRSQVLVELDPHLMAMSQLSTAQSMSSLPPFSPTKYK
ncbi:hypothetical protein EON65_34490 [archaeon]|nr:MAG: hypothetical protein EON65_34490 [archaeon]